jgi:hypothetical protein
MRLGAGRGRFPTPTAGRPNLQDETNDAAHLRYTSQHTDDACRDSSHHGEGGIRTPDGLKAHTGFRDRDSFSLICP